MGAWIHKTHERRKSRGGRGAAPKWVLPFLLLPLAFSGLPSLAAPALRIDSLTAGPGQDAHLTVSLNADVQGLAGLLLKLRFDRAAPAGVPPLDLVGLGEHRLSPAFSGTPRKDYLYGSSAPRDSSGLPLDRQRLIALLHPEPVDGPVDVIRLPFKVPADSPPGTVYTVEVLPTANDAEGRKIPVAPASATITVTGGSNPPGDVDGNGRVEVGDAVLVLRFTVGLSALDTPQQARADVNGNQQVEVGDAVGILRIITGAVG
ncbi:MAG: dockerin type I repeat-containing protein [Armatimonadetes bacterium]|nr:dockerin type I repeat-containing protein [Armatimonadota bacterium]